MSRIPKIKELINTRLANGYGGWIYCESCNQTIGYLCYVTYDSFCFSYQCKCGGSGTVHLSFVDGTSIPESRDQLIMVKNRWCCPADQSPLFSANNKRLSQYSYEVVCSSCNLKYMGDHK